MSNEKNKENVKIDDIDIEKNQQFLNKKRKMVKPTAVKRRKSLKQAVARPTRNRFNNKERYGKRTTEIDRDKFFKDIEAQAENILGTFNSASNSTNPCDFSDNEHLITESKDKKDFEAKTSENQCFQNDSNAEKKLDYELVESNFFQMNSADEYNRGNELNNSDSLYFPLNENGLVVKSVIHASNHDEFSSSNDISFQKSILAKLDEILVRVSCIEKNIAKNDIRLKEIETTCLSNSNNDIIQVRRIDDRELNLFKLPVSSKESLNELEKKLGDKEFMLKMVMFRLKYSSRINLVTTATY